jgi:GT2 family glycosyltransferase
VIYIAAIIATFNRIDHLRKLVYQLEDQWLPKNVNLLIIVVNDGSNDGTNEIVASQFPEVHILQGNGNWWWTKCMNEGFKKALKLKADYILILNDDTEIRQGYISTLWTDYQTLPKNAVLGSASISIEPKDLIDFAGTKDFKAWCLKTTPYLTNLSPMFSGFKGIHPTWTMNGRGSFMSAGIFDKIGMYDEQLVQYGSDDEFAIRARKAGLPVFISWNARVYNNLLMTSEGTTFRKDPFWKFMKSFVNSTSINSLRKSAYIYKKHGFKMLTPFYLIYTFLGTLNAYIFKYRNI